MILFRLLRRLTTLCLLLVVLSVGLGFLWYRRERDRDPMPLLDRGPVTYRVLREDTLAATTQNGEPRIFHEVTLDAGLTGLVQFTVSLPKDSRGQRLPAIVILPFIFGPWVFRQVGSTPFYPV